MKTDVRPIVRPAQLGDIPQMLELVKELALFEKAPMEVTVSLEEFTSAGFGDKPVYKAWVVEEENSISAFALCYIRYSTWKGRVLYLEDLYVTETRRNAGLGKLLFNVCLKEVKDQKLKGLVWQVLDWNEPAIAFYQQYGCRFDGAWINCSLGQKELAELESVHGK